MCNNESAVQKDQHVNDPGTHSVCAGVIQSDGERATRSMSLVSTVEQLIKSYKVHQAEINDSIQRHTELLQSLVQHPVAGSEESEVACHAEAGTDASQGDVEDIELLERALQTALRVRSGSECSRKHPVKNKRSGSPRESGIAIQAPVDTRQSAVSCQGSHSAVKLNDSNFKSGSIDRKSHRKAGSSVRSSLVSRPASRSSLKQAKTTNKKMIQKHPVSSGKALHRGDVSTLVSADHVSTSLSINKTVKNNVLSAGDLGHTELIPAALPDKMMDFLPANESGVSSAIQQSGRASSERAAEWRSLRNKQNRLWDKVSATQRKPAPGRARFMERMRATFPKDWPRGSPDQTGAAVDTLNHRGRDLLLFCLAKRVHGKQGSDSDQVLGGDENSSASSLANEKLLLTAEKLQKSAAQVKREWKAWDRWRPEGGCLCTAGANCAWGDGPATPLPLTVTYTTEEELEELERLRVRAALLRQEIHLEQALLDALAPLLASIAPGPGCPNPSVLRELYSLLGEGGELFPAIVLDSESD